MIYRENTAYDFERFAPKSRVVEIPDPPQRKKQTVKKGQASSDKKAAAAASLRQSVTFIAAVAAVLLLVVAQLYCQLQNSEVVDAIGRTEKAIETLQSENTRLQVELEGKVSFTNMEEIAKSKGMQKMTVAQTEYINLCQEDTVEVIDGQTGLLAAIRDWF